MVPAGGSYEEFRPTAPTAHQNVRNAGETLQICARPARRETFSGRCRRHRPVGVVFGLHAARVDAGQGAATFGAQLALGRGLARCFAESPEATDRGCRASTAIGIAAAAVSTEAIHASAAAGTIGVGSAARVRAIVGLTEAVGAHVMRTAIGVAGAGAVAAAVDAGIAGRHPAVPVQHAGASARDVGLAETARADVARSAVGVRCAPRLTGAVQTARTDTAVAIEVAERRRRRKRPAGSRHAAVT